MNGFTRECYVYEGLLKEYERLRNDNAMKDLSVPEMFLADPDQGILIMENLKMRGFVLLNRVGGEGNPYIH